MTTKTNGKRLTQRPAIRGSARVDLLAERYRHARRARDRVPTGTGDMTKTQGTITFLFSDIEGSTRLLERAGSEYPRVLDAYRAAIRNAVATHGGHEFGTEGDALFVSFERASDALSAALDAQRTLSTQEWPEGARVRARMGIHTGEAIVHDDDYVGMPLHETARICAAGHGGQVLVSEATSMLVGANLPDGVSLLDLGEHHLKDLSLAKRLFQMSHADLPDGFAPLRSLETLPNNLPLQLTTFVGREAEMAEVRRLLHATRLLTLTGAGGAGKSRLALQVAGDLVDVYPDGVWFVELAPIADPSLIPQTIAAVLGVTEQADRPVTDTLAEGLRAKHALIVLDNVEHLTAGSADVADLLLRAAPMVQILATGREALGIAGETTWRVPSLSMPAPDGDEPMESITQYEAVRLFIDRARQANSAFAVTARNAPAVAHVCHRLDGIPLAIELAAARVRLLAPEQIAERLDDAFRLLTGGSRTALPRQQTLRALIDWSYDILSEPEQTLLRRLSVFAGGFDLDAVEGVCARDGIDVVDILPLLGQLVDKSLVHVEHAGESARYRLLETIRQYARQKLVEAKESALVRDGHATYYATLPEREDRESYAAMTESVFQTVKRDLDNVRAALEWALDRGAGEPEAIDLAGALGDYWYLAGRWREGSEWLERALDRHTVRDERRREALLRLAMIRTSLRSPYEEVRKLTQEAHEIALELQGSVGILHSRMIIAWVAYYYGDYATFSTMDEGTVQMAREFDDERALGIALSRLAWAKSWMGDNEEALELLEESRTLQMRRGETAFAASTSLQMAQLLWSIRDLDRARALCDELLGLRKHHLIPLDVKSGMRAGAMSIKAFILQRLGDTMGAVALVDEALELIRAYDDGWNIFTLVVQRFDLALAVEDVDTARRLADQALGIAEALGSAELWSAYRARAALALYEGDLEAARFAIAQAWANVSSGTWHSGPLLRLGAEVAIREGRPADAEQDLLRAIGESGHLGLDAASAFGLESLAAAELAQHKHADAARHLAEATKLIAAHGIVLTIRDRAEWDPLEVSIRSAVPDYDTVLRETSDDFNSIVAPYIADMGKRIAAEGKLARACFFMANVVTRTMDVAGLEPTCADSMSRIASWSEELGVSERARTARALADELIASTFPLARGDELRERAHLFLVDVAARPDGTDVVSSPPPSPLVARGTSEFRRDGEYWTIAFRGKTLRMRDTKGLRYIAVLLGAPGREFHVRDLAGEGAEQILEQGTEMLDDDARAAYRRRIADLNEEIDEATAWDDGIRAAHAREEIDVIEHELAAAYGLGGRARTLGDPTERTRKAVTNRIRDALARIVREHEDLGRHLTVTIRTGTFCAYEPDPRVEWSL